MDAEPDGQGSGARALVPQVGEGAVLDLAVAAWLDAKGRRSGSERTRRAYRDTLDCFRGALAHVGLALDGEPRAVALVAQAWAGAAAPRRAAALGMGALAASRGPVASVVAPLVAPATFNQRLAIVSSFYVFARRADLLPPHCTRNPMDLVERRVVQTYAQAHALDEAVVAARLAAIDRATLAGLRDYALLAVALTTGRRLAELAGLRYDAVAVHDPRGQRVQVAWRRTKGGKALADELPRAAGQALTAWLAALYGTNCWLDGDPPPDAPVWVSLATNGTRGRALSVRSISDIYLRRLGTSKVHTSRHTFAHGMESVGAKVSDIQHRLGHASLATTGRYLAALRASENAHGEELARLFGVDAPRERKRTR